MSQTSLINVDGYIESVRYLGLTTLDSVKELIDNSLDADSTEIYINIFEENDEIQITIEDNGRGIRKDDIDKVLSFGGRESFNINSVGKFGWGLPSTACCQTIRTELYSKIKKGEMYFSYIDLEELKENDMMLPTSVQKIPNYKLQCIENSGTFIHLINCDNLDYKRITTIEEKIIKELGETYRYFLNTGKKIFINGKSVQIIDPLLQIEHSNLTKEFGISKILDDIEPIIFEDITDPITKKPAEIKIKVIIADLDKIKNIPGYRSKIDGVFNLENQGFYIVRNNREIGRALSLGIYNKHNDLNYFRGEIIFPSCLDKFFGVHTNKSRYTVKSEIKDKLENRVSSMISQIRAITKSFRVENLSKNDEGGSVLRSESIINNFSKENGAKEIIELDEQDIRKEEKMINAIQNNDKLTVEERKQEIKSIKEKNRLPWKFKFESRLSADFFEGVYLGKQSQIIINTDHPFYHKMYLELKKNDEDLTVFLELLLFAIARGQQESMGSEDKEDFYIDEKQFWSNTLRKTLNKVQDGGEDYNE